VQSRQQSLPCRLGAVSEVLYLREGFRGNSRAYYDPRNSYLNDVLTRRLGIPISLGIVYIEVARRAGLNVYGIPTPGHFVLGCAEDMSTLYVDPFSMGEILDLESCRHRIERALGREGVLSDEHFRPATHLEIAARVLKNLKAVHVSQSEWTAALPVQRRLALLLPGAADERRDLGLIFLRTGSAVPALALLEKYVEHCSIDDRAALEPYLRSARRMVAELN
jgi:regulator of sirC expression with transglutaminase-like and TPR domain